MCSSSIAFLLLLHRLSTTTLMPSPALSTASASFEIELKSLRRRDQTVSVRHLTVSFHHLSKDETVKAYVFVKRMFTNLSDETLKRRSSELTIIFSWYMANFWPEFQMLTLQKWQLTYRCSSSVRQRTAQSRMGGEWSSEVNWPFFKPDLTWRANWIIDWPKKKKNRLHSQAGICPDHTPPGSDRFFRFCAQGRVRWAGANREEGGEGLERHNEMQILYDTRWWAKIIDDVCATFLHF